MANSPSTVVRRAVYVVMFVGAAVALSQTTYLRAIWEVAFRHSLTAWLARFIIGLLVVLTWRNLGAFALMIRARGRVATLAHLLTDPADVALRRRWNMRFAAIGFSTLLTFGIAELLFRVLDIRSDPMPAGRPSVVDDSRNALGIREDWDSLAEEDPRLRVAFLGDSFVYGAYVEPADTFCHLTETLLTPDWPTGVVTINLGEPDTAPGTQLPIYMRLREQLRPDVVVQVIYLNDLGINLQRLLMNIHSYRDPVPYVVSSSYVLSFAEMQLRYWRIWNKTFGYYRGGLTREQRHESWAKLTQDVRACRDAIQGDGVVYALVMFPWLHNLDRYELTDVHANMRALASELGVPYLDLLDTFSGMDATLLRTSPSDDHPNETGHLIAAERIAQFLREKILPHIKR